MRVGGGIENAKTDLSGNTFIFLAEKKKWFPPWDPKQLL